MALWLSQMGADSEGIGGAPWTARGIKTLATGVLDCSDGPGRYIVASEAGAADDLTQITGLALGEGVRLEPDSGDTITVTDGASLLMAGVNFPMESVNDTIEFECTVAGTTCKEISRSDNT